MDIKIPNHKNRYMATASAKYEFADWINVTARAKMDRNNERREQTLDIIMEQVHQHNIGTNRYHQRKMLDEILRLQTNRKSGQRPYRLSREVFDLAASILLPDQIKNTSDIRYENFVK